MCLVVICGWTIAYLALLLVLDLAIWLVHEGEIARVGHDFLGRKDGKMERSALWRGRIGMRSVGRTSTLILFRMRREIFLSRLRMSLSSVKLRLLCSAMSRLSSYSDF